MTSMPHNMPALIAAMLRDEITGFDRLASPDAQASFLRVTGDHGVDCLLRRLLKQRGSWLALPAPLRAALDERARYESALEAARRRELTRVLEGLREGDVRSLVLKGAGLAYTHYPAAYLRPCCDVDLFIRREQLLSASARLEALGYRRINSMSREAVHAQWMFELRRGSLCHVVDLHWAISNRPLFAAMLSFDELARNPVPVASLGDAAATPAPIEALLFACIHRVAHHNDSHLLIWLFDVKLLAERFSSKEWELFIGLANSKQLLAVCRETLAVTAALVGGCEEGLQRFRNLGENSGVACEASAAYLGGVGSRWRSWALDVKGAAGAAAKLRLIAGHAFPAPEYMREAYGATSLIALVRAYARRAAMGTLRTMTLPLTRTWIAR
jgi:hypothetical protein